ncbi:helix-turn-helix domain-containing protein [Enterococcus caccae]|uniref:Mga helix-turn-helix domain-containing protein n=1 Tax=Enterococcus caccae ATCC BAA-1240 TaxID=1158612 RepID=R3U806_9ENTE|nr:helix-turn-helix domain-containing protein [Enterococcus caccae]EOL50104.1 hypothetical protein UC7_00523 [Enterococcus caccae ATCC BAA-1240]EOT56198.1 hypothetical protein I580_02998 [Enterococcus caccae ATCC BAA-1240]OJG25477.1 hypothetical protein RU98_GL001022 [Enterococcus caccae]
MKNFFMKKNDQQKFEIFKLIRFSQEGISGYSISKKIDLSLNLVYRKIKMLSDDLNELFEPGDVCIVKNDVLYTIVVKDTLNVSFVIDTLRLHYIQQSHEYLIFRTVLLKYYTSVEALSQDINLSIAHTYKSLTTINKALNSFKIELNFPGDNTQVNFEGAEIHIRLFLFYFYWNVFKGLVWPFRKTLEHMEHIELPIENIPDSQQIRLRYFQALSAWRIRYRGVLVHIEPDFLAIITLLNKVHPITFSLDLAISGEALVQEECYFAFLCRIFIYDIDTHDQKLETAEVFIQSDLPLAKSCTFLLDSVYKAYNVTPNRQEYLFSYYSLLLGLTSITYLQIDNADLLENDQNISNLGHEFADFPQMEAELAALAKKLFSEDRSLQSLESKGFLTYIVYLFYFILDSSKKTETLNIYVQYSKNHFTTEEIKNSLLTFFNPELIRFVSNIEDSDVLISDCDEKDYPNNDFFYFENPVNTNDWHALINYINNKAYNKCFYKQF